MTATAGRTRLQPVYRRMHGVALAGRNFGPSDYRRSGEMAALLRAHDRLPATAVIVDVGANLGGWTLEASRLWPAAHIHAFEPSAVTYRQLTQVTAGLNVRCVRAAVSEKAGVAKLHSVPQLSGLSSLHHRDLAEHGVDMTDNEEVSLVTLDDYCEQQSIARIDFLKIDAEGHDLAVLLGARELLNAGRIDIVQFEFGGANIDSRTYLRDFVRLLEPRYRITRLLADGAEDLRYSEREEVFVTSNFVAERLV